MEQTSFREHKDNFMYSTYYHVCDQSEQRYRNDDDMTWFDLMHKNVKVAEMNLDETGTLLKTSRVRSFEHMPYGTVSGGALNGLAVKEWWRGRSIPASRSGIRDVLEQLELSDVMPLVLRSMGMSLSDHYWIRPVDSDITWEEVNFFDNPFSEDMGEILFGAKIETGEFDLSSPDNTSDGVLKKKWRIMDSKRCLIKAGTKPFTQEPYNEVIASRIADLLGIPHVKYSLMWEGKEPCSVCGNMVDANTELVPAARISSVIDRRNDERFYDHYVRACDSMGVDITPSLDRMIVLDYLIVNTDRHRNNFGIIRNADTLEWIGAAPLFDNGTSLMHDVLTEDISPNNVGECKPFGRTFEEQIGMVSSFDWIDADAIDSIPSIVREVLSPENGWNRPERTEALSKLMESRVKSLGCRLRR